MRQHAGLHRQDAVFLLRRCEEARRAGRLYAHDSQRQGQRGRRVCRRALRRYHDNAGSAEGARRRQYRRDGRRKDYRVVLINVKFRGLSNYFGNPFYILRYNYLL